jgi:protein-tyrosine phosphatase
MTEPKTNRDVINAMTDEELAKWKNQVCSDRRYKNGYCRIYWQNPHRCRPELSCTDCVTAWLKAPAGKHQEVE